MPHDFHEIRRGWGALPIKIWRYLGATRKWPLSGNPLQNRLSEAASFLRGWSAGSFVGRRGKTADIANFSGLEKQSAVLLIRRWRVDFAFLRLDYTLLSGNGSARSDPHLPDTGLCAGSFDRPLSPRPPVGRRRHGCGLSRPSKRTHPPRRGAEDHQAGHGYPPGHLAIRE